MAFLQTLLLYKWVILFYGAIILLLYIYRKRFDHQGKFVLLYRTKWGLKLMDKIGRQHASFIQKLAFVGIIIGYLGMVLIVFFLLYGLYQIIFVPGSPPPIQPVIPGVPIPGSPIKVPLIIGWVALFFSAVIHEFSHGVVARACNIKIKSSGFAFIGPLGAAFVEPDENQVKKQPKRVQNSMVAAGPFANVLLAGLMFLVLILILSPVLNAYLEPDGVSFQAVQDGYPAQKAGVEPGVVYTVINGQQINSSTDLLHALENVTPNETVYLGTGTQTLAITATSHPQNESRGYIGVIGPDTHFVNDKTVGAAILLWLFELFNWTFLISLGLGLANLMPLGPVDGGRLFHTASEHFFGKKKGLKVFGIVTVLFIILLIVLFLPILKATGLAILKGLRIIP